MSTESRQVFAEPIVTDRLRLDPLSVADADADEMFAVYADPRMYEFTGGEAPTADGLRRRYESMAVGRSPDGMESWLNWIVRPVGVPVATGAMQATVVHPIDPAESDRALIAWEIGVEWQGRGYAGEAAAAVVRWLFGRSITSIGAHIHPGHAASQAVATRAGLHRSDAMHDGEAVWVVG